MQKNIIMKKNDHWYVLPAGTDASQEIMLSVLEHEEPNIEIDEEDLIKSLIEEGWEIEMHDSFAA